MRAPSPVWRKPDDCRASSSALWNSGMSRCGKARVIENGFSCATVPIVLQNGSMKRALLLGIAMATAIATSQIRTATQTVSTFAALSEQLSEPNGDFDTDNLISNESSYLHVIPALEQGGVTGGVYIGVGPDQNFSYIGRIRPASAFIIDIRRDNLLLHLLFKALFAASRNRTEYLSILTGRPAPDRLDTWRDASIDKIVMYLDGAKPLAALYISTTRNFLFCDGRFPRYLDQLARLPRSVRAVVTG